MLLKIKKKGTLPILTRRAFHDLGVTTEKPPTPRSLSKVPVKVMGPREGLPKMMMRPKEDYIRRYGL